MPANGVNLRNCTLLYVYVLSVSKSSRSTPKTTVTGGLTFSENGWFATDAETLDKSFDFSYGKHHLKASLLALNC